MKHLRLISGTTAGKCQAKLAGLSLAVVSLTAMQLSLSTTVANDLQCMHCVTHQNVS